MSCYFFEEMIMKKKKKLLDIVRDKIQFKHYSIKTEQSYVGWIKRYILFHNKRHPIDMGRMEIEQFLTWLAVEQKVSPTTQNQAFSAILFLYREALGIDMSSWSIQALRAKESGTTLFPSRSSDNTTCKQFPSLHSHYTNNVKL